MRRANDYSEVALTNPPIDVAQNHPDAQLRLAAQARLYSEIKRDQWVRLGATVALGVLASGISLVNQGKSIGVLAGVTLLFLNGSLMYRERRRSALAVAIQEDFDCLVLQLPWNEVLLRRRPTGQEIVSAADRYDGDRTKDWYPSTGMLLRPLDIAVCQQSNVGWGAPVHRVWGWMVVCLIVTLAVAQAAIWSVAGLSSTDGLDALIAPFLATYWEAIEMSRRNFESARQKEACQAQLLEDWAAAMAGNQLTDERCRRYQDAIARIRQQNAQVPDWLDRRLKTRSERAMRATADDMINQAARASLLKETL